MQTMALLARMEQAGMAVDLDGLERAREALRAGLARLEALAGQAAGGAVNVRSSAEVARVLYERLALPLPPGALDQGLKARNLAALCSSKTLRRIAAHRVANKPALPSAPLLCRAVVHHRKLSALLQGLPTPFGLAKHRPEHAVNASNSDAACCAPLQATVSSVGNRRHASPAHTACRASDTRKQAGCCRQRARTRVQWRVGPWLRDRACSAGAALEPDWPHHDAGAKPPVPAAPDPPAAGGPVPSLLARRPRARRAAAPRLRHSAPRPPPAQHLGIPTPLNLQTALVNRTALQGEFCSVRTSASWSCESSLTYRKTR